jgi:trehalose/maltose hydrolase-like predicted phosphorylase
MAALWRNFQVECDDPFITRRMRSAMFYLTCGYRRDVIAGGAASGVASRIGWGGSVFWDTEFYMFPSLLLTHPDLARNILLYRHATLGAAKRNALNHGEKGARFVWQSHRTGKLVATGFEDERHVTTDIAFSAWWYAQSTGDRAFLKGPGRALIVEAARNVASRSWRNGAKDRYEIHGVVPPDEHVLDHHVGAPVNNSAMTNAYAQWTMRTAAGLPGVDRKEAVQWRRIAGKMYLPRDRKLGIYREYDGYNGHPIKQADIGHLFFPLCVDADREEIRRNVYYYADRERETGLYLLHSPMVYAAALSRAGDAAGVQRFYKLTELNRIGPFELPRESNYNSSGPTVSGSGAFLTLMLQGVLGIENFSDQLSAHPCVPEEVGRLTVAGLHFRGARYAVSAAPGRGPTLSRM